MLPQKKNEIYNLGNAIPRILGMEKIFFFYKEQVLRLFEQTMFLD